MQDPKDQPKPDDPGKESRDEKRLSDERWGKAFDELDLTEGGGGESAAKAKATADKPAEKKEPLEDKSTLEKKPFKILKVQGKDYPVMTEEEYDAMASKGADYTKKTQQLADDRRVGESELKEESKRLADEAKKFNDRLDELIKAKALPKEMLAKTAEAIKEAGGTTGTDDEEAVYKEFEIDPKYAQPFEIKAVKEIARQRKELGEIKEFTQDIARERANTRVNTIITKERETHPYEEIIDDQGQNLTQQQLASIVTAKRQAAERAGEKPNPESAERWIKEAVQEVHLAQKKVKETLAPSAITEEMDLETILAKNPILAEKIKAKYGEVKTEPHKDKIPPALPSARTTVATTKPKAARPGEAKSMSEQLDAGFEDPDVIKALGF